MNESMYRAKSEPIRSLGAAAIPTVETGQLRVSMRRMWDTVERIELAVTQIEDRVTALGGGFLPPATGGKAEKVGLSVDSMLADTTQLGDRLEQVASRVAGVMQRLEELL